MPERSSVFEVTQLGPETVPGTTVSATRKLLGTTVTLTPKTENKTYRAAGSRMTTGGIQNREWSEGSITQDAAQYTDLSYILASLLGPPAITNPSSGVYLHEWDPLNWTALTPKTFTIERGSYVRAMKAGYGLVKSFGMEFKRDGVSGSGSLIAQRISDGITLSAGTAEVQTQSKVSTVSGGTFTISFMGETTSAIAYNASNATVLAALEALPNIAPGDVALASGPVNTGGVTFTFAGQYASSNVPLMTIDSTLLTGGGSYTIAQTTAGASLTELTQVPISGNHWDFYLDTSAAGLGGTKLTRCFMAGWQINEMYGPVWPGNTSNTSFATHTDLPPSTTFKFMVEADSTGMAYAASQLRSGDLIFPRIKATGPTLGVSTYLAQLDFAVELKDISELKDQDGVMAVEYTGEIAYDKTWGQYLSFDLRNNIAAIA